MQASCHFQTGYTQANSITNVTTKCFRAHVHTAFLFFLFAGMKHLCDACWFRLTAAIAIVTDTTQAYNM